MRILEVLVLFSYEAKESREALEKLALNPSHPRLLHLPCWSLQSHATIVLYRASVSLLSACSAGGSNTLPLSSLRGRGIFIED